jgi:hypothetical protein
MRSFPPRWCKGKCEYNDSNNKCKHPDMDPHDNQIMCIGYCPLTREKVKCGECKQTYIRDKKK